jgi:hypothetical protein
VREPGPLTVSDLAEQWLSPLGYAISYTRISKVLRHLGLSASGAVTEDGQAKLEAELLSRGWTRKAPMSPSLLAAIDRAALAVVTDDLLEVAIARNFWQRLELEVQALGGDHARARAWVEHTFTTTRIPLDGARAAVLEGLRRGAGIPDVPTVARARVEDFGAESDA